MALTLKDLMIHCTLAENMAEHMKGDKRFPGNSDYFRGKQHAYREIKNIIEYDFLRREKARRKE